MMILRKKKIMNKYMHWDLDFKNLVLKIQKQEDATQLVKEIVSKQNKIIKSLKLEDVKSTAKETKKYLFKKYKVPELAKYINDIKKNEPIDFSAKELVSLEEKLFEDLDVEKKLKEDCIQDLEKKMKKNESENRNEEDLEYDYSQNNSIFNLQREEPEESKKLTLKDSKLLKKIREEPIAETRKRLISKWNDPFQNNIVDEECQLRIPYPLVKQIYAQKLKKKIKGSEYQEKDLNELIFNYLKEEIDEADKTEEIRELEEIERIEERKRKDMLEDKSLEDIVCDAYLEFEEFEKLEPEVPYSKEAQYAYDESTKLDDVKSYQAIFLYCTEKYTWKYCFYLLIVRPILWFRISNLIKLFNYLYIRITTFFIKYILKFLDLWASLNRYDETWSLIRKRFFFRKLFLFLLFFVLSYILISDTYEMYIHRFYSLYYEEMPDAVNLNAFYEGYNLYKHRLKDWDDVVMLDFNTQGSIWAEDDDFIPIAFFYKTFAIKSILEMWLYNGIYLMCISTCLFFSIFFRNLHNAMYGDRVLVANLWMLFWLYLMCTCWFYWEIILSIYHYMPRDIVFYFLWGCTWTLHWTLSIRFDDDDIGFELYWYDEYDRDVLFEAIPRLKNENPDCLEKLPDPYALDPDAVLKTLLEEKQHRVVTTNPGGMAYQMYRYEYYSYDRYKSIWENIRENWDKFYAYVVTEIGRESWVNSNKETMREFLTRYFEEMSGPLTTTIIDPITGKEEEVIVEAEEKEFTFATIKMIPFDLFLTKNLSVTFISIYWTNFSIPSFIRRCYKVYVFFHLYNLIKKMVKEHNKGKKNHFSVDFVYFSFLENFKFFFGYKNHQEILEFSTFSSGYIVTDYSKIRSSSLFFKPLFRVINMSDKRVFNKKLYNLFRQHQYLAFSFLGLKRLVWKLLNLKHFIFDFFGSINFWISVLLFWKEMSPTRIFCRWLFITIIWHYVKMCISFIWLLPYRYKRLISFFKNYIIQIFRLCYSFNIIYWSFLLYSLSFLSFSYRILSKNVKPVGPFNYYNSSPWRHYKVKGFWKKFFFLFRRKSLLKVHKLNLKGSFLVWSKKLKKK